MGNAKPGRKRKQNVVRDSSGKSRGEIFDPSVIFGQPHRRDCADPSSEYAAYPLGRLWLNKQITADQLRAGNEFASVARAFGRVMGIPVGSPRSGSMSECVSTGFYSWEGDTQEIDPVEAAKRVQRVKDKYNDIVCVLTELGRSHNRGLHILSVMRDVCITEQDERQFWRDNAKLGDLRLGLNAAHRVLVERRG